MEEIDLIKFLVLVHEKIDEKIPLTKYEILKKIGIGSGGVSYKKIDECIALGIFEKVEDANPPKFIINKKRIWNIWKDSPIGKRIIDLIADHVHMIGGGI